MPSPTLSPPATSTPNIGGGPGHRTQPPGDLPPAAVAVDTDPMQVDTDPHIDVSTAVQADASASTIVALTAPLTPARILGMSALSLGEPVVDPPSRTRARPPNVVPVPTPSHSRARPAPVPSHPHAWPALVPLPTQAKPALAPNPPRTLVDQPALMPMERALPAVPTASYRKLPEYTGAIFSNAPGQEWVTHYNEFRRQLEFVGELSEEYRMAFFLKSLNEHYQAIARYVKIGDRNKPQTLRDYVNRVQEAVTSVKIGHSDPCVPLDMLKIKHEENMPLLNWLTALRNYHHDLISMPGASKNTIRFADELLEGILLRQVRQPYLDRITKIERDWVNNTTAMPSDYKLDSLLMVLTEMAHTSEQENRTRPAARKPEGPPAKKIKTEVVCRYGNKCTRSNCRFQHQPGYEPAAPRKLADRYVPPGNDNRPPRNPHFNDYQCTKCHKKGHTARFCKSKDFKRND
jgi:hypothetical protein